jgi:Tfp pilus assembly protein PilZ
MSSAQEQHNPQRREARYPARIPVIIRSGSNRIEAVTGDVSYRGLFVCTDSPPVLRQLITVEAVLPTGDQKFVSHGMSVFVRTPKESELGPPGVGVQFYAQGTTARRQWEEFINYVRAGGEVGIPAAEPEMRRNDQRYEAVLAVRPRNLEELEVLYTRDVSRGGMFLSTELELEIGNELRLDVYHPTSKESFPLISVVRHRSADPPLGVGVQFSEMTEQRREQFLEFVRDGIPALNDDEIEVIVEDDPQLA